MFLPPAAEARLRAALAHFRDGAAWYERHGVPRNLGILLHGPPGTGKTSTIKALANTLGRHIVSVNLALVTSRAQLMTLFNGDSIHVRQDRPESDSVVRLPTQKRLVVLEDVDCMTSAVLRRPDSAEQEGHLEPAKAADGRQRPKLTLADLLNVLDGLVEPAGRVVVMTTNRPEALDPALIRPGRIDVRLELAGMEAGALRLMLDAYLDADSEADAEAEAERLSALHGALTPAHATALVVQAMPSRKRALELMESEARRVRGSWARARQLTATGASIFFHRDRCRESGSSPLRASMRSPVRAVTVL